MTNWTQFDLKQYMAKRENISQDAHKNADTGPENTLQSKIVKWADQWGHPILSFPQTPKIKRFLPAGWPDIVLILHKRVLFIELKSKRGRLSNDQKMMKLQFMALGHEIHEIRSYKAFLELTEGSNET